MVYREGGSRWEGGEGSTIRSERLNWNVFDGEWALFRCFFFLCVCFFKSTASVYIQLEGPQMKKEKNARKKEKEKKEKKKKP